MNRSALVIGYGSIGQRHRFLLEKMGFNVSIVSQHFKEKNTVLSIEDALQIHPLPQVVAICSPTFEHQEHFRKVLHLVRSSNTRILIEKPLGFFTKDANEIENEINSENIAIGYNLRFHPLIQALKSELVGQTIRHASIEIMRYLPTMRGPDQDYRKSYSCYKAKGGGVLNDFSHDLDLALWLFGSVTKCYAQGGKIGKLHGDSMDYISAILEQQNCPKLNLQMSYLDQKPQRRIRVVTEEKTYELELDKGVYHGFQKDFSFETLERNHSYRQQWHALISGQQKEYLCNFSQADKVEQLIHLIENQLQD